MRSVTLPYEHELPATAYPLYVIEGIDGSGKSSIGPLVARQLQASVVEQPASFRLAQPFIDEGADIHARFLFYLGYNLQASAEIRQLARERPAICIRYLYSTIVYHIAKGLPEDWVWEMASKLPLVRPRKVFFLDVSDPAVQQERIGRRGATEEDKRTLEIMSRIRSLYLKIQPAMPGLTYIDTSFLTMEEVTNKIINEVKLKSLEYAEHP